MRPVRYRVPTTLLLALTLSTAHRVSQPGEARALEPAAPRPPERLSETGLYVGDGSLTIDPRNRPFAPQYPLWTDGALKARWVWLPPGETIDATNVDAWDFPVGTKFWKEFAFNGRRVETRLLWRSSADGWTFATYLWNEEQTDAVLAPDAGAPGVIEFAPNRRHNVPGIADCRTCHDAARTEILGFNALQLSTDRDPNALHAEPLAPDMVTLRTLVEEGTLRPARPELLTDPPRIAADTPRARAALGYLSANCGGCHNPEGSLASLGLFLKQSVGGAAAQPDPVLRSTLGRTGHWEAPGPPPTSVLIHPGAPELSTLLLRMRSRRPSSQMPPLGTVVRDRDAVDLVTSWIREDLAPRAADSPP